ncbi:flagellin [Gryllotalpicola sp.]|uniref:flagellin N-terminal helical domain-containing protein n=1 Tax=Gryllotalpicola sp. TaxID=1932787 RepID=UPI00262E3E9F|nr:flagellin [Gryllotalpicola sp.]
MGFSVNTNVPALEAYNNLNNTQGKLQQALARLSSGYRINTAGDDAAGLAISEGLQAQVSGTAVAQRNAQDGISMLQTADGALTQVQSILHRIRDLAVQGANGTNTTDSYGAINTEIGQLSQELTRIGDGTSFNGIKLFDGSTPATNFQVGTGTNAATDVVAVANVNLTGAGGAVTTLNAALATPISATAGTAQAVITAADAAISAVSTGQATLGADENRFSDTVQSLAIQGQNLSAANSRIRDTDMASEMVTYSQASILQQAGVSMLAQANSSQQGILKLLGN